jgi:hypothetical protein
VAANNLAGTNKTNLETHKMKIRDLLKLQKHSYAMMQILLDTRGNDDLLPSVVANHDVIQGMTERAIDREYAARQKWLSESKAKQ